MILVKIIYFVNQSFIDDRYMIKKNDYYLSYSGTIYFTHLETYMDSTALRYDLAGLWPTE